ncbi:MAG: septum formation initiator family protein [Corynebacterium camporealensis]|uniref:septum formation initiator family protein n=1 Tax=Corynebacterium camporealensis TaxID=161896 RepID=UPI002A914E48|nr:septum formation initiator family protein [Corynebacterium camporealensis]MDY5839567.1 septum formation initiator family protein [Corynebacterium camporealensis]
MARKKNTSSRTTVPVASRATKGTSSAKLRKKPQVDIVGIAVIVSVVLLVLLFIATPLRNYYQGRSEIAYLNESIAAKEAEKARLTEEIERYESDEFLEQEARRRFGLVEEGEMAYRILDPRMQGGTTTTTDKHAEEDSRSWEEVLWESFAEPPENDADTPDPGNLPIQEDPVEEQPAP